MDSHDRTFQMIFESLMAQRPKAGRGLLVAVHHQKGFVDDKTVQMIKAAFFSGYDSFLVEDNGAFKVPRFMAEFLLKHYDVQPDGSYQTKCSLDNEPLPVGARRPVLRR